MIPVLHPASLNWFYEKQAAMIANGLAATGCPASAVSTNETSRLQSFADDVVLIVNFAESMNAASEKFQDNVLKANLARFKHRVLVNYDCVFSPWFSNQMAGGPAYFSAIFDVSMARQISDDEVLGIPYTWIPEAIDPEASETGSHTDPRPLPWALIGHATLERTALVSALVKSFSTNGFVFSPSLRPFNDAYGLDERAILKILGRVGFYIWGSHHAFPYHEALRVPHAIMAGAVPVKIDPLYSFVIDVPWIYESIEVFKAKLALVGRATLFEEAHAYVASHPPVATSMKRALARLLGTIEV